MKHVLSVKETEEISIYMVTDCDLGVLLNYWTFFRRPFTEGFVHFSHKISPYCYYIV